MIDVTDVDMVKFVQKVYELSQPQGMGMLHFQPGGLTSDEAEELVEADGTVSLDYVKGRSCKMYTRKDNGRLVIGDKWYDHTDAQLSELLEFVGIGVTPGTKAGEHGGSCNCADCRTKRGEDKYDPTESFKKGMKGEGINIETWEV